MLEVHIDIRRLTALLRDETLEQQIVALGIDGGDAKHIADRAVGGGTPALTKNVPAASEANDRIHREKVRRVLQGFDQPLSGAILAGSVSLSVQVGRKLRPGLRRCSLKDEKISTLGAGPEFDDHDGRAP